MPNRLNDGNPNMSINEQIEELKQKQALLGIYVFSFLLHLSFLNPIVKIWQFWFICLIWYLITRLDGDRKAYHENANGTLFAIDVEPEGDYGAVCDILYKWENESILAYETCEARQGLGFDAE